MTCCSIYSIPENAISRIGYSNDTAGTATSIDTDSQLYGRAIKGRKYSAATMSHGNSKIGNIHGMVIIRVRLKKKISFC
jgi:hypothetical protein